MRSRAAVPRKTQERTKGLMRLQSAIFSLEDTLPGQKDAERVLSLLKMEGVWLYGVTDLPRAEAERLLAESGVADCFRGLLAAEETGCAAASERMLEKALRRLRSERRDTLVFTGRPELLRCAKEAGFRVAAVRGAASPGDWAAMRAEADETVECYSDFLR